MKKGILLLLCLFFCVIISNAQSSFVKALGGSGDDIANSAIQTADGNYLIIGSTSSFGSGGSDGYVSKVNGSAKEIWDRAVGGFGDDNFQNGIQLSNGHFILVGSTNSIGNGNQDLLVVRMDNFGSIIWTKTFGGNLDDQGYDVHETSDGNLLLLGYSESFGQGRRDILIYKISLDGAEIWGKTFGSSGNEWFNEKGVIEDSQGNYVIACTLPNNINANPSDGLFLKLNSDGDIIEYKVYGGDENDGFNGYIREYNGGYQNIGRGWSWNGDNHEIWMTDLDSNGNLNWSKTIGLANENISSGMTYFTADGNYLISGYEFSSGLNANGKAILLKLSQTGDVLWSKSYGDIGIESLLAVFETNNGIIAFGKTSSYGQGNDDIFIIQADEFGSVSGCSENIQLTTTDVIPESRNLNMEVENVPDGDFQVLTISNVDFDETLVCDGCSADDLVAGLYCETAPIICSIDCLDGFTGTLPDEYLLPQPDPLCSGNGIPNNVSWFAFVAGSNTVDLTIVPSNCTTIYDDSTGLIPQTIGIQAGIYYDCSFTSSIACQTDGCMDLIAENINLSSNDFVEGQTYYLFVDGCGGSICDYEVVVNSAQQAFEMDEITTISNNLGFNLEEDTLCQGTEITLSLDNFDQDVNFSWSIDPATVDFPSGVHPVTDTSAVTFQFSEEGCFDIHVYAYNECDVSETKTISICVKALEDEYFSDIYVCQECFPITLVAPESGCIITEGGGAPTVLIEDPNGDGVPGWLGTSTIDGPGLDSNMVTNIYGCEYTQYVNVIEIPLSPREQVDYYHCLNDFPVDINGTIFNNPGDTRNITIEGGAASGCDSLMSITAYGIDFNGNFVIGNCESGEVELAIVVSNVPLDNYDSITYIWYDENGDIVMDSNGIDSVLVVMGIGSYSVQVFVEVDGVSCPQTIGPIMVDVDNLAPTIPTVTYAPNEVCVSEFQAQIYVADQNLGETYVWTLTPNLPFSFGLTTDTIYVDITSGQDFEFCVHAVNGCGPSNEICDNVDVVESPSSEFAIDDKICIDSFATIEYIGSGGMSSSSAFNWDFNGGTITNGMNPNSGGPFEVEFPNAGIFTITLITTESGCNSILTTHTIEVVEPYTPPMIDCESEIGSVTFTWDNTTVEDLEINILSGQTSFEWDENSSTYTVDGLNSEEIVNVQFIFNASDICGAVNIEENCTSLPCPDVVLEISLSDQDLCLEDSQDIMLNMTITGDDSGVGAWDSPHIYSDSIFSIRDAGMGLHFVSYSYQLGDCIFTKDTVLVIFSAPILDIDISLSFCDEMGSNMLDVFTSTVNSVLLDEEIITIFEDIEVAIGDHVLTATSPDGCTTVKEFTIDDIGVSDLAINGEPIIIKDESEAYSATFTSNLDDLILIWTLDGDTICEDCFDVNISPEENTELCVSIEYGNGCLIDTCMLIEVNERTELHIPNVFSPNGDNINDLFSINSNNTSVFVEEIMIFDRWGELVFNKKGFDLGEESNYWDGRMNGSHCVDGVYVYVISYLDEENRRKKITGDLTLVR